MVMHAEMARLTMHLGLGFMRDSYRGLIAE